MRANQWFLLTALGGSLLGAPNLIDAASPRNTSNGNGVVNGLDTKTLIDLSDKLKQDPAKGRATFFSDTRWKEGMKSITTFSGYKIDGKMKAQERQLTLKGDEMTEIGGTDTAPGAIEEMMYAVGTCIVAAANANAALMGIKLTKLEVALESDIDMHGLMGLDPKVRPGVLNFRTTITIGGAADAETLKQIAMKGYNLSPVSDTVRNGVAKAEPPKIVVVRPQ